MIKKQFFSFSWKSVFISSLYQPWVFYRTPFSSFFFSPLLLRPVSGIDSLCDRRRRSPPPPPRTPPCRHRRVGNPPPPSFFPRNERRYDGGRRGRRGGDQKGSFSHEGGKWKCVCGEKSRARKSFPCSIRVNIFAPFFDISSQVSPPPRFPLLFAP